MKTYIIELAYKPSSVPSRSVSWEVAWRGETGYNYTNFCSRDAAIAYAEQVLSFPEQLRCDTVKVYWFIRPGVPS